VTRPGLAALALLLVGAPASASGQQALTVEEAIRQARLHSPAYQQALNDLGVADARTRAGWAAFLPSLSLSANTGGGSSTRVTGESDAGEPIRLPSPIEYSNSSSSQTVSLNMTLFEGGRRFHDLGGARADAVATRSRVHASMLSLDAQVASLYWQLVQRERRIAIEESLLAAALEQLEGISRMVAVAAAGPEDVLGAEVDVAAQELALERARGEARKAELALLETMGVQLGQEVEPTSAPPPVIDPASLDREALIARAVEAHPDVVAARAAADAAEDAADAARSGRWPTIGGSASYGRSMGLSSYDALFEPNPENRSFNFGLSVSLPIFNRFQTTTAIATADASWEDAQAEVRARRLAVERAVREALIDLDNAARALALAERSAELSRERVELARERFRLGGISFTELQSVINRAAQAERDALDARFGWAQAWVALDQRTGGVLEGGVGADLLPPDGDAD